MHTHYHHAHTHGAQRHAHIRIYLKALELTGIHTYTHTYTNTHTHTHTHTHKIEPHKIEPHNRYRSTQNSPSATTFLPQTELPGLTSLHLSYSSLYSIASERSYPMVYLFCMVQRMQRVNYSNYLNCVTVRALGIKYKV